MWIRIRNTDLDPCRKAVFYTFYVFSCQREREVALVDPSANRNGHSISNRVHIRPTGEEVCHMLLPQLVGLLHGVVVRVAALALQRADGEEPKVKHLQQ